MEQRDEGLKDENGFLDEEIRRTDILYDTRLKKQDTECFIEWNQGTAGEIVIRLFVDLCHEDGTGF